MSHTDSLYTAALMLAKGAHRVAVLNEVGQVVNIVSQSSVINFLAKHVRTHTPSPHHQHYSSFAAQTKGIPFLKHPVSNASMLTFFSISFFDLPDSHLTYMTHSLHNCAAS
jgi:hypothetical protein